MLSCCFPPFSLSCKYIYIVDILCAISAMKIQRHKKISYSSETLWAPIRCVIWRLLSELTCHVCTLCSNLVEVTLLTDLGGE